MGLLRSRSGEDQLAQRNSEGGWAEFRFEFFCKGSDDLFRNRSGEIGVGFAHAETPRESHTTLAGLLGAPGSMPNCTMDRLEGAVARPAAVHG
jgi:hypothetical protein